MLRLQTVLLLIAGLLVLMPPRAQSFDSAPARGLLLVANKGDQTVGIIDPASNREVATVPEGGASAHELIASPDGRLAYAPIYGNSGVGKPGTDGTNMVVVDIAAHKVIGHLDFPH